MTMPPTKTQRLIDLIRAGAWPEALSLASTFRMLGEHRATIVRAHQARHSPSFFRQLGRDPAAAVEAGRAALLEL